MADGTGIASTHVNQLAARGQAECAREAVTDSRDAHGLFAASPCPVAVRRERVPPGRQVPGAEASQKGGAFPQRRIASVGRIVEELVTLLCTPAAAQHDDATHRVRPV